MAMLGIVGPIVNIEHARPIAAVRRSLRLTSRHLWLVVVAIGIPLAVEVAAHHWLLHVRHEADVLTEVVVSIPLILTVGAFAGTHRGRARVRAARARRRFERRRHGRARPRRPIATSPCSDYRVIAAAKLSKFST